MLQLYQHLLPFSGNIVLRCIFTVGTKIFQPTSNLSERKRGLLHGASGPTVFLVTTKADTSSEQSNNKSPGPWGLVYTEIATGFRIVQVFWYLRESSFDRASELVQECEMWNSHCWNHQKSDWIKRPRTHCQKTAVAGRWENMLIDFTVSLLPDPLTKLLLHLGSSSLDGANQCSRIKREKILSAHLNQSSSHTPQPRPKNLSL